MIDGRSIHLDVGRAGRAPGKRTLSGDLHKHLGTPAKVVCGGPLHWVKSPETPERCRTVRALCNNTPWLQVHVGTLVQVPCSLSIWTPTAIHVDACPCPDVNAVLEVASLSDRRQSCVSIELRVALVGQEKKRLTTKVQHIYASKHALRFRGPSLFFLAWNAASWAATVVHLRCMALSFGHVARMVWPCCALVLYPIPPLLLLHKRQ